METIIFIVSCWLLTYLIHSTAFYGIAKLLTRTSAFAHHRAKEILWKVALCGGLLTASAQVFTGIGFFTDLSITNFANETTPNLSILPDDTSNQHFISTDTVLADVVTSIAEDQPTHVVVNPSIDESTEAVNTQESSLLWNIVQVGFWTWAIIGSVLLIRLFAQKFLFIKAISPRERVIDEPVLYSLFKLCSWGGIDQKIVLTSSAELYSPLAMNRGEICLPERSFTELSPEQQQSMLAHELAHIVHQDYLWLKCCNILETILFFQPLNRLMRIELQEVIEQRCDEWAIRSTGNAQPLADCLVKVAEWIIEPNAARFASGMALHQSSLRQRIINILKNQYLTQKEISRMKIITILAIIFILALVFFPGKTWLSVSFAHDSKFGSFFNHQSFELGKGESIAAENNEKNCEEDCEEEEMVDMEIEAPEMPEAAEIWAGVSFPHIQNFDTNSLHTSDTLRFGKDFMLITKGNGRFEVYKGDKLVEKEDYEKYKEDFVVKNDNNVEILSKNGVNISTGKEREYTPWVWSSQGWDSPVMPALAPMPNLKSFGNNFSYGFSDNDYRTYYGEKDGKEVEVRFDKDGNIKYIEVDGESIKKEDFSKYQEVIDDAKKHREKMKNRHEDYEGMMFNYNSAIELSQRELERAMQYKEKAMENAQRQMEEMQEKNEELMRIQERNLEILAKKQEKQARMMEEKAREMERKAQEKMDKVLEELVKDGLIKNKKSHFEMRINKRGLFVDDVKQSDELYQKYKKMIGAKSDDDDNWSFHFNN